jgi:hypothetical protein
VPVRILLALLLAMAPMAASAQFQAVAPPRVAIPEGPAPAPGGTNAAPDFYPPPKCEKPAAPPRQPTTIGDDATAAYNARVRGYNQKAVAYNSCIKTYVDNAQADIQRIQDMVHAAVTQANQQ